MFNITFNDVVIGTSALEKGDAPMGCANGVFIPAVTFDAFKNDVAHENDRDPSIKRWVGLSATTPDRQVIACIDVVLFATDFGDDVEIGVDVIGIDAQRYQELFPNHLRAYEDQFK